MRRQGGECVTARPTDREREEDRVTAEREEREEDRVIEYEDERERERERRG
jgi:hypothetical protein